MRIPIVPLSLFALTAASQAPEPKTEAAVIAADDAWLKAELAGDATFLDALLLPGYVSIGASGTVTPKSRIVANAGARDSNARAKLASAVASWRALHPIKPAVSISGNTAILQWIVAAPSLAVVSSDVFVYRDRRWRAIYSQHSSAGN